MKTVIYHPEHGGIAFVIEIDDVTRDQLIEDCKSIGLTHLDTAEKKVHKKTHLVKKGKIQKKSASYFEAANQKWDWIQLRQQRHVKLSNEVDTLNSAKWETMSERKRQEWRKYRQQLLDLPANTPDPRNPKWPEKPE